MSRGEAVRYGTSFLYWEVLPEKIGFKSGMKYGWGKDDDRG